MTGAGIGEPGMDLKSFGSGQDVGEASFAPGSAPPAHLGRMHPTLRCVLASSARSHGKSVTPMWTLAAGGGGKGQSSQQKALRGAPVS